MEREIQRLAKKPREKLKCNFKKYSNNPKEGQERRNRATTTRKQGAYQTDKVIALNPTKSVIT